MTPMFKVTTRHTKEVLQDFIRFTYKVKNKRAGIKLALFAGCFFILAVAFKDISSAAWPCGIIGVLILIFIFTRKYIAFAKLAEVDDNYKNQSEIHFVFGQSGFDVENMEDQELKNAKYGEISDCYKDDRNYFVAMESEELYVLPFGDFVMGKAIDFEVFIKDKMKKEIIPLKKPKMPLKERLRLMNELRKAAEAEQDRKIQERKDNKTKK